MGAMKLEYAAAQLEALGNPTRLAIYRALVKAGDPGLSVGVLQKRVKVPAASTLSHHLRSLIQNGLVVQERQSTVLICRAVYPAMEKLVGFLSSECCVDAGCASADVAA